MREEMIIKQDSLQLAGHLSYEKNSRAWVIFAHGSGSSRHSSRNNWVAGELNRRGYGTFLFDLLTPEEDQERANRFDMALLAGRLTLATDWLVESHHYEGQPLIYFGASTGAGAALKASAIADPKWPLLGVISRGGRPDLAGDEDLSEVRLPVLLIVGSRDEEVIKLNRMALAALDNGEMKLVEGATHLFEEEGTLQEVVNLSLEWLERHVGGRREVMEQSHLNKGERHV